MFVSCLKFSPHVGGSNCLYVEVILEVRREPARDVTATHMGGGALSLDLLHAPRVGLTQLTGCAPF